MALNFADAVLIADATTAPSVKQPRKAKAPRSILQVERGARHSEDQDENTQTIFTTINCFCERRFPDGQRITQQRMVHARRSRPAPAHLDGFRRERKNLGRQFIARSATQPGDDCAHGCGFSVPRGIDCKLAADMRPASRKRLVKSACRAQRKFSTIIKSLPLLSCHTQSRWRPSGETASPGVYFSGALSSRATSLTCPVAKLKNSSNEGPGVAAVTK
mgnify:CR=1 FL=1